MLKDAVRSVMVSSPVNEDMSSNVDDGDTCISHDGSRGIRGPTRDVSD